MRGKRKRVALIVSFCLIITTILPGFSYSIQNQPELTLPVESAEPGESVPPETDPTTDSDTAGTADSGRAVPTSEPGAAAQAESSEAESTAAKTPAPEGSLGTAGPESTGSTESGSVPDETILSGESVPDSPQSLEAALYNSDGSGPQVTKVRVLKERNYLEIYWDREVEDSTATASYKLKNGETELTLLTGNSNTMYFNGYAMSSIGFRGSIDESQPITLEIVGEIKDTGGNLAEKKTYEAVYENYYKQSLTTDTGIVVKASADVQYSSLLEAKKQIDTMLGKTETGIAARLAEYGASMALYGPHENAYFVPEHRYAWDPDMYEVEGYGGNQWNDGVSSIAEKNVIRVLDGEEAGQTKYRNENILVHEFGHSVKSLGMDLLADKSLSKEFQDLYRSRKRAGMWPNTYAISNSDEFFATMCTIWFSVMAEKPDWTDGVRSPINTREDLLKYDPETYAFFAKIFPDTFLDSPWDPSTIPNDYDDVFVPAVIEEGTHDYGEDVFKLLIDGADGKEYHLEQFQGVVLWWNYGDADINSWTLTRTADGFHITTLSGDKALAPTDDSTVALADADITDQNQLWNFVPAEGEEGKLIHLGTGKALGLAGTTADGTALKLVGETDAPRWRIQNLTKDTALIPKASHDFGGTYFRVTSAADGSSIWENWENGKIWITGDSDRNSWKIVPAGGGYVRISPKESPDMALAPENSGTAIGTRVLTVAGEESDETQLWSVAAKDGSLRFVNKASGLAIGVKDNDMTSGNILVLAEISDSAYQLWDVVNKTTSAKLAQPDIPNYVTPKNIGIDSIRLIEEDYVEIVWSEDVTNSTLPENYKLTINGKEAEIDPDRCFYYRQMTSLGLKERLDDPKTATGRLEITGDITAGGGKAEKKTYDFAFDPFYTQSVTSQTGIVIRSSSNVQMSTLELTAKTIDFMLSKRPDIAQKMLENHADIAIHGTGENAYYIPEYRVQTDPNVNPAAGLGGNMSLPTSTFAESAVIGHGENVLVHEFGHAIKALGISQLEDQSLIREYEEAFIHAKLAGLWPDTYAISNAEEFFACVSTVWFECGRESESGGTAGPVNLKSELLIYDPLSYEFFSKIYPDERLPEGCWNYTDRNDYPVTEAPNITEPEPPVDPDDANLPTEDYDLDQHYFKIYSYLGTNVVNYEDGQVNTWWDFSNSGYNYNFDTLSWKLDQVGDYYRFTSKLGNMALMPEGSGTALGTRITAGPVDQTDDSQLWQLVRVEGYFCQLVNKASGFALGTQYNALPADGTILELVKYAKSPSYSQQWRVLRLKDQPGDANLHDNLYAVRPLRMDYSKLEEAGKTALGLDRSLYTKDSLRALDEAMAQYDSVLENGLAPQERIDAMAAGIENALDALKLVEVPDDPDPDGKPVTYTPKVTIRLTGDKASKSETFRFTLEADAKNPEGGAVLGKATASITGAGSAEFGEITFRKSGDYRFTIRQEAGKAGGYTYDTSVWTLKVTVAENDLALSLAKVLYESNSGATKESAAEFTNQFKSTVIPPTTEDPGKDKNANNTVKAGDESTLTLVIFTMAAATSAAVWLAFKKAKYGREE